jgi:hypothetical protein
MNPTKYKFGDPAYFLGEKKMKSAKNCPGSSTLIAAIMHTYIEIDYLHYYLLNTETDISCNNSALFRIWQV